MTERHLEKVGGRGKRKHGESRGSVIEWRVLENGVLAVKTPLEVVTPEGKTRCIWFEPRKKRLVCPHGWGQYHLGIWNGPRAADFPKPAWTTCDCKSATGLCARKKLRGEVASDAPDPKLLRDARGRPGHGRAAPGPDRGARAGRGGCRRRRVLHGQGRRRERAALPPRADHAHARRPGARAAAVRGGVDCSGAPRASHRGQGHGRRRPPLGARLPRARAGCSWRSWWRCTRHARPEGRGGAGRRRVGVRQCLSRHASRRDEDIVGRFVCHLRI